MKTYPVPADLLQEIVRHFQQQPWIQANNILAAINQILIATDRPDLLAQAQAAKPNGDDRSIKLG